MQIRKKHRRWALLVGAGCGLAVLAGWYALRSAPTAPGRSLVLLSLGAAAAVLIVFSSALGLRRRLSRLGVGTAAGWLRAHLWLSWLSLVLSLAHSGARASSPLGTALVACLLVCVGSGAVLALVQRIVPGLMAGDATWEYAGDPLQTITQIRGRAYQLIWAACGHPPDSDGHVEARAEREAIHSLLGAPPPAPERSSLLCDFTPGQKKLESFYRRTMLPFFRAEPAAFSVLHKAADAKLAFDALSGAVAPALHPTLHELSVLCHGMRVARRQIRFQAFLRGWSLLHIPLAMATLTLLFVHAVTVFRY
ncbi:MAG: hypothetical protein JNJ46_26320 [Myxococcales bacterium]|nr:hypothetical protein [Myxococcales bacterium]